MKLDRNTNRGGHGKYALVNMRKLLPHIDKACEPGGVPQETLDIYNAFRLLVQNGLITLGNETAGDQFFVMKYKDKFTAEGLRGYATAVAEELRHTTDKQARIELAEFCARMFDECHTAEKLGTRIPD